MSRLSVELLSCRVAMTLLMVLVGLSARPSNLCAQKIGEVPKVLPSAKAAKGETLEWTSAQGRPFWYRLPQKIDAKKPPNLIFMLHGTGLNHGWSFWNYGIGKGRFRKGDIVVSPDGLTPGSGETFNFVQGKTDGDQIAGLIKLFRSQFPIGKVYLYGHSQGAFFCYWFAGAYTELVDGIIAHAGNVLQVNHNKLAKKKVAICILHGKADAVVDVACAYRTEKIYREQGYEKLKLEIVEGLTEQSGHWPLPVSVAEMFEWLDQVSADSPDQAFDVALSELAKEAPDFSVVSGSVAKALRLSKKLRSKDRKAIEKRLEPLRELLDQTAARHAAAIEEVRAAGEKKAYGSWAAHFRTAHAALGPLPKWRKAMKSLTKDATKHDKSVARALDLLAARPGSAAFRKALKTLEGAHVAARARDLQLELERLAKKANGLSEKDIASIEEIADERRPIDAAGEKLAAELDGEMAKAFRAAHENLFEKE